MRVGGRSLPGPPPAFPGSLAWRPSQIRGVASARSRDALTGRSGLETLRVPHCPPTSGPQQKVEGLAGSEGKGALAASCVLMPLDSQCVAPLRTWAQLHLLRLHLATAQAPWRTSRTCDFLAVLGDTGSFPRAQGCFRPFKTTCRFSSYLEFCSII